MTIPPNIIAAAERRQTYLDTDLRHSPILVFADAEVLADYALTLIASQRAAEEGLAERIADRLMHPDVHYYGWTAACSKSACREMIARVVNQELTRGQK